MALSSLADLRLDQTTRIGRALALLDEHGAEIERVGPDVFLVPSSDGEGAYRVTYGLDHESCTCKDHEFHPEESCKHLLAVAIGHAKRRRRSFRCEGCGKRFPARECVEVGDDHLTFFEGDPLCGDCALHHGVL